MLTISIAIIIVGVFLAVVWMIWEWAMWGRRKSLERGQSHLSRCCEPAVAHRRHGGAFGACLVGGLLVVGGGLIALPFLPKMYYCQGCRLLCSVNPMVGDGS